MNPEKDIRKLDSGEVLQFRGFKKNSSEGKIHHFLKNYKEKLVTPNTIRMNCKNLSKKNFSDSIKILEKNRVVIYVSNEILLNHWKNTPLLDKVDEIWLISEGLKRGVVVNSEMFLKRPYQGLDRIDFSFWDMYFESLIQKKKEYE